MIQYKPTPETKPGNEWMVKEEKDFLRDYGMHKDDLPLWHEVLVGQGRFWQIARLRYRIGPVFDLTEDALDLQRPWSISEIAAKLAQPPGLVEAELSETWRYWQQQRALRDPQKRNMQPEPINLELDLAAPADSPAPVADIANEVKKPIAASAPKVKSDEKKESLPSFAVRRLELEQADVILADLGINVTDPQDRLYVASRAICYERWLTDPLTREVAMNLIHNEITLRNYRRNIDRVNRVLDEKSIDVAKRTDLMKEVRETEAAITKLSAVYHKSLDELGGEQSAVEDMKREAINTLGFVTQAIAKYRSNGDCSLIDGVFTAREIVWLTTPVPMRPGQYRPDAVAMILDALKPENLFNPEYKPPAITREACRRLRRMSQIFEQEIGVADNRNSVVEAPIEMDAERVEQDSSPAMISPHIPGADVPSSGQESSASAHAPLPFAFASRQADEDMISFIPSM